MPPITPPAEPPGTPPTTPPTTPELGGGAATSSIIFTCFGILVGARNEPSTISLTFCTCWICGVADRKSTRLNSSHKSISYAVFCLKKKNKIRIPSSLFVHHQETVTSSRQLQIKESHWCCSYTCPAF